MTPRGVLAVVFDRLALGPLLGQPRPDARFWRRIPLAHRAARKVARAILTSASRRGLIAIAQAHALKNGEGDVPAAERILDAARRRSPGDGAVLRALFDLRVEDGRSPDALRACLDAARARRISSGIALTLAWVGVISMASARAAALARSSAAAVPEFATPRACAAFTIDATDRLLAANPTRRERAVGLVLRALALDQLARDTEALAALAGAQAMREDLFWAPYLEARFHAARGELAPARAALERTLALKPDFLDARWDLAAFATDWREAADLAATCFEGCRHYRLREIETDIELDARDFRDAPVDGLAPRPNAT